MDRMNKKGIYITLITIMLLGLFILFLNMNQKLSFSDADKLKAGRIKQINQLINDIRIDAERAVYIAGFRTMIGMTEYIREYEQEGIDTDDEQVIKDEFIDIMIDGTTSGGDELDSMTLEGGGFVTLDQWKENIKNKLLELKIDATIKDIESNDIEIGYINAFELSIKWTTTITLTDDNYDKLKWVLKDEEIKTILSIEGFEDPLYIIGSEDRYSNVITKAEHEIFSDAGGSLMREQLRGHIENQRYVSRPNEAPSFLQRFMKKENYPLTSRYGIESFVFVPDLLEEDREYIEDSNRVALDFIAFGYDNEWGTHIVDGLDYNTWFFITTPIAQNYGIENHLSSIPE